MMMGEALVWDALVRVACIGVMKLGWGALVTGECELRAAGGEDTCGEGGQKDGSGWGALEREVEGDEAAVTLPLVVLLASACEPMELRTPAAPLKARCCGGSRGEAVGGGRCFGGDGEG